MDAKPAHVDWYQLNGDWYYTPARDVDMYPRNVEVIETIRALGGTIRAAVDIGAHVGFTAIPCARLGATVWAYEANPWTFGCLAVGVLQNDLAGLVRPFQLAVTGGRSPAFAEVRSTGLVCGMAGLVQSDWQPVVGHAPVIDAAAVFDAVPGRIDYLKLDIEGGEHELLPSVPAAYWKRVDWFHLETHDVTQEKWHARGARNIDWESLIRSVGFERVTPALWRMT